MAKNRKVLLAISGGVLLLLAGFGYYFRQVSLPHFRTVDRHVLYRSGQPRGLGLLALRLRGIHTIINLRSPDGSGVAEEEAFAAKHGIAHYNIPAGSTTEEIAQSVERFLAVLDDKSNWPVLVHCARGKERSGVYSAVYRMEYEGWSNQKALYEMQSLGLKPGSMLEAETFVWNYRPRNSKAEAEKKTKPIVWQE